MKPNRRILLLGRLSLAATPLHQKKPQETSPMPNCEKGRLGAHKVTTFREGNEYAGQGRVQDRTLQAPGISCLQRCALL
ncbi:hypothetical protein Y032_0123g1146 [Ancylostoma ceylanicum]|uniref:Uncharacterized protein n=1 Tax=Ancylostoma ceylanicum TaxID=53326 RepID=A0A016T9I5_9BILA|nr:hypothetical protein Y032_0123g1146 [Ancylostoma ceylanicum]